MTVARSPGSVAAASASRSAGVADAQRVVRLHVVRRQLRRLDDEDPLQVRQLVAHLEESLEEPDVLDHRDRRLGVVDQVLQLLGRRGVVDRDRRRPQERGGQVDDVELGPVAHHQHDPLARFETRRLQPAGNGRDLFPQRSVRRLLPRVGRVTRHPPQRDDVGVGGRGAQEHLRHRVLGDHGVDLVALRGVVTNSRHRPSLSGSSPPLSRCAAAWMLSRPIEIGRCATCAR